MPPDPHYIASRLRCLISPPCHLGDLADHFTEEKHCCMASGWQYSPSFEMAPGKEFLLQWPDLSNFCFVLARPHFAMACVLNYHSNSQKCMFPGHTEHTQNDTTLHPDVTLVFWQEILLCIGNAAVSLNPV